MRKGSLSIFFALIMVFVMGLTFSLAELVRVHALLNVAEEVTEAASENGFSEYNAYLWDKYKILAIDLGYGTTNIGTQMLENRLVQFASNSANPQTGLKFTRITANEASVDNYGVLTDFSGNGVLYQGIKAAKENLLFDAIDSVVGETNSTSVEEKSPDEDVASGKSTLEEMKAAKAAEKANAEANGEEWNGEEPEEVEDNPLDAFAQLKEMMAAGVLGMLIENEASSQVVNLAEAPSHRTLNQGNGEAEPVGALDKVLFCQYLISSMSSYNHDLGHDGLDYEVEYVLCGKASDSENLAAIAERLLLVREAINFSAINSSAELKGQVSAMASILCSFAPAIQPLVETALTAAWAFVESVLEVRTLLDGGRVAYVKDANSWNSDLWHLSNCFDVGYKASNVDGGISYIGYLRAFLALEAEGKLGIRSCDIFENALHTQGEYINVLTDNMLYKGDMTVSYSGNEIFASLFKLPISSVGGYQFKRQYFLSY